MDILNKHPMDFNNTDEQDILKTTDANVDESTDTTESETSEQEEIDYKALFEKEKQIAENQKIRAEKAENKLKGSSSTGRGETSKQDGLSPFDLIAVAKANLDEEQLKEAMDYAKYKKISISEALKTPQVKATIALIEENNKVAQAAAVGNGRRGSAQVSDDLLLANANNGIMPESDADLARLIRLRKR